MNYFYEVSIPANTAQVLPYTKVLQLTAGTITRVSIIIPAGHQAEAHLKLLHHEFQIYPLSRGEDYHGDDTKIDFQDAFSLDGEPFALKAVGWNTDTVNAHAFLISLEVTREGLEDRQNGGLTLSDLMSMVNVSQGDGNG